jgi:hypothetical protein
MPAREKIIEKLREENITERKTIPVIAVCKCAFKK